MARGYQKFKTKKGARCSIENLLKRVLKGNPVGSITPSVDIYNTVSLTHALPVGGEDIDAMDGDIRLGITEGGDAFRPLGEEENAPTLEGELVLPRRRRRHLPLLELARRRAHGPDRRLEEGLPHHRVRGSGPRRRPRRRHRSAGRHGAQYLGADIFAKQIIARDNPTMVIDE